MQSRVRHLTSKQQEALTFINKYQGIIRQSIRKILFDYHLAEDAYQETVVRFLRYYNRINTAVDIEVLCYLKAIANNTSLTIYNRHYKIHLLEEADTLNLEDRAQCVEDIVINHETNRRIYELILQMDAKYSAPLLMHIQQGMPYRDIAKILGISADTARARVHRARNKLKAMCVEEKGGAIRE